MNRYTQLRRARPIKKHSRKRAIEMRLYYQERRKWMMEPEHQVCVVCLCLGKSSPNKAVEVHHIRGRIGRLLRDQRFWAASCRDCRKIPHLNPKWAREVGLLSPAADWNVYPV